MNPGYKRIRKKILKGETLTEEEKRYYLDHIKVFGVPQQALKVHNKFLELLEKERTKNFPILNLKTGIKE